MKKNKNILGKELSKFTKVALSGLMVVTCAHFSYISAEDTDETNTEEVTTEVTQVEEDVEQEIEEEIPAETEETVVETSNEEVTSTPETTVETTSEPEVTETIVATEEPYEIVVPETKEEAVTTEETVTEEEQQDEEIKLDEMTSVELFNYIMSISADELDALYDEYPNLDDLMANFTEEEQEALANKFGNAEEDIELAKPSHKPSPSPTATPSDSNDATFTVSITNAEVAYFAWHESSDTTGNITFTSISSGTVTIDDFTTNNTWDGRQYVSGKPGYVVFFVKTDSEHLVTGLGTSGNGDVFPIDTTDWGNISGYPGLSNVVKAAKEANYEIAFGYSASAGETKTGNFEIVGQKPEVTVTASTSAVNVKPNQEITFTVTITPEVLNRTSVTGVKVTSATINGQDVTISELTGSTDGSYTGTVTYTVTEADCESGSVSLVVQTSTEYKAEVKSQGQGGTLYTKSTITSEATTSCSIAEKSKVQYEFTSATEGKSLPTEVTSLLPSDTKDYYTGETVTAQTITSEEVNVDEGTWKFNGWDATSKIMTDTGITFTGSWSFTQKNGKAGYYLSLSNATWNIPDGIYSKTEGDKTKYYYNRKFAQGDTFTVVSEIPTAEGYQFIGWLDKERTSHGVTQEATIRNADEPVTYFYKDGGTYTLDALWASIAVTGTEVTYDGEAHTISSADIAINEGTSLKPEYKEQAKALITRGTLEYSTDNVKWSTDIPTFTDAGEYTVYVREIVTLGGQAKTLVGQGTIKINKKAVTFTGNSDSKVYNGQTQTVTGYTANGLVNGHEATLEANAEGKDANTYTGTITDANSVVIKSGDTDVTKNYAITTTPGKLIITPITSYVEVTITGNKGEFTYDGNPHTVSGFTVTASNDLYITEGENKFYSYSGTASVTKTDVNPLRDYEGKVVSYVMGLLVNDFENISNNFTNVTFRIYDGEILINPARLTITTPSASKPYDGTPLTADGTYDGLVNGETIGFDTTGTITEVKYDEITKEVVGETNTYSITWKADGNEYTAKQSNYDVVENLGTLTINPTEGMKVDALSNVVYNGQGQKQAPTVTDTKGTTLVEGTDYTITYSQDVTNVGTVKVTVTGMGNYTGAVEVNYQITPATLYVTTPSATKVYDGTSLTENEGASITGLVNNETVTFQTTGSQTEVGSSDNTYEINWNGTASQNNYEVVETDQEGHSTIGKLVVTEYADAIVVTTTGGVFPYDGNSHGATVTVSTLPTGYTLETATSNTTVTNVTSEAVAVTCDNLVIRNAEGEDVTSKLSITKVDGTIQITPVALTVNMPGATKVYDGTPLTAEGSITGLVNNETVTFQTTGSQTEAGSSDNTYDLTWDGSAQSANYTVSETIGTLTVTAKSITPDTPETPEGQKTGIKVNTPDNHVYDATEHKEVLTVTDEKTGKTLVVGKDYEVSYSSDDFTNVHEITITVTGKGNYTGSFTKKYAITPATVKVTAEPKTKVYGEADPELTATVNGTIGTDKVAYTLERNPGEAVETYAITAKGETTQGNYTVEYEPSTLTITQQSINPEDIDSYVGAKVGTLTNVQYNGLEQKQTPTVTDKEDKALAETDYTITYSEDVTNVGTVTVTVVGQGNYTGTITRTYQITPATLKVVTDSATKQYDGKELTAKGSISGLVNDETVAFSVTGSQTNVGKSTNTYSLEFTGTAKKSNYTISETLGTLEVTKGEEKKDDPKPTPTPSVNPGCPAGTMWNEDAKVCQTIVVPVTPTVNPTPNTPVVTPSAEPTATPEATASAEPEKSAEPTASAETIVDPDGTPEVARKGHWALINLVAAIVSVLLGIVLVLSKNKKDKDEDEEQNENEDTEEVKRHKRWKVVSVIDAVLAVVVFIFTENMRLPMVLVDKWTMLMVLFAVVSVISLVLGRKYHENEDDEENAEQA